MKKLPYFLSFLLFAFVANAQLQERLVKFTMYSDGLIDDSTVYKYSFGRGSDMIGGYVANESAYLPNYPIIAFSDDASYNSLGYSLYDTAYQYYFSSGTVTNIRKYFQVFDNPNKNVLNNVVLSASGAIPDSFENFYAYNYAYDANNNMISDVDVKWENNNWQNEQQDIFTYDNNHNILSHTDQTWDTLTQTWENVYKDIFSYNQYNELLVDTGQYWNLSTNNWKDTSFNKYVYIDSIINYQAKYFINPSGNFLVDSIRYVYNVADDTLTFVYYNIYSNSTYDIRQKLIYAFDANRNIIYAEFIPMNYSPWGTTPYGYLWQYDSYNQPILWEPLDSSGADVYQDVKHYYYETYDPASVQNTQVVNNSMQVYPNPGNDIVYFKLDARATGILSVTDLAGRTVEQKTVTGNAEPFLNTKSYVPGIYIYQLNTGKNVFSGKFTVR